MGIDLGGHQPSVSHHAADGLYRHAQRERDMRSVFGRFEVRGGQSTHIAVADTRIAGKEKQVADEVELRHRKRREHLGAEYAFRTTDSQTPHDGTTHRTVRFVHVRAPFLASA